MGLSTGGEAVVLAALLAGRYVSLHTADPGNTGASEVTTAGGTAYARQAATFTSSGNNPTTYGNDTIIQFPIAGASWGTITHFGIWSAATAGTFYGGAALSVSKAIAADDVARFPISNLTVTAD